jgi:hypothetical protein
MGLSREAAAPLFYFLFLLDRQAQDQHDRIPDIVDPDVFGNSVNILHAAG